jgi:hypothetical protein
MPYGGIDLIKNPNRQVQKQGPKGGLALTLPADWCRANDVQPGQMIRLEEVVDATTENRTGLILRLVKWSDVGNAQPPTEKAKSKPTATHGGKG